MKPSATPDRPLDRIARGLRGRTFKTMRLASRLGLGAMKRTFGRSKGDAAAAEGADDDGDESSAALARALRDAQKLASTLGDLKGLAMKMGQMASYLPGALPPQAQEVLATLQADTRGMAYDALAVVIEEELGAPPEQCFDSFEQTPFAAASIGQVHRARFEGRDLAVKVQYPGVREVLSSDLKTFALFSRLASVGTAIDGKALAREMRDRMLEECDYALEAERQRLFCQLLADDADCSVPAVIDARSSARVLSSELSSAASFARFRREASQQAKDRAAQTIFRISMRFIFERCLYNADPHPGNYLFEDDGRVVFLDFGCVRAFEPQMIDTWKRVARSVVEDDRETFRAAFSQLGLVGNEKRFDWDHQWKVMHYLYRPFTQSGFRYSDDYVRESYDLVIFKSPNRRYSACPPQWVFLNRLQWGLNAILGQLDAAGDWPRLWREAIDSETRPLRA